ncbi:nitrous oxide reductase family maturation protein NosD [Malonomonas rubra]|uniref:right-handed parallel beta-helix repeat-containing protein n=1 Tax=Malonomonas rubra TaxID=57040 RepID=UPI0026EB5D2B|nr:NosD domain-containing protein [Malonomonas rubra]
MWLRAVKLLLLCLLPANLCAAPLLIEGTQTWLGAKRITDTVKIPKGAVLQIAAGSQIEVTSPQAKFLVGGRLLVEGTAEKPVVFKTPAAWEGIEFVEAEAGSRIVHARFTDCQQAIGIFATSPQLEDNDFSGCAIAIQLLRESQTTIENCRFVDNQIGLKVSMRSSPTIRDNHFSGNQAGVQIGSGSSGLIKGNSFSDNQQGINVHRLFTGEINGNSFSGNKIGIQNYQTRNNPVIKQNQFQQNEMAIVAVSFSYPTILQNNFIDNGTALHNDQFGSAKVEHNLFKNNRTAIYNNRKSNPQVRKNLFENNQLALFCDYSSYPEIKQNHFLANQRAVELGIYQSADWEQQAGSTKLLRQKANERKSRNPLLAQAPTKFTDRVDITDNWWGEQTELLQKSGAEANLDLFFDRRDKPLVSYPGYGDQQYRLDLVVYAPWLNEPVADVGPEGLP